MLNEFSENENPKNCWNYRDDQTNSQLQKRQRDFWICFAYTIYALVGLKTRINSGPIFVKYFVKFNES